MKIAIVGYGVEGQENYRYWSKDPTHDITIVDQNEQLQAPTGVKTLVGKDAFENLNGFDLVVRSPGIAPFRMKTDGKIWSGTNEFFEKCPAEIIGVTGSKGKGTTSSLIASILEAAGRKVWLVGNIGVSALEVLEQIKPDDIVVYELSSFQLWDIEKSPQTAVVLYIEQDHLDVHRSIDEYVEAKANITNFQSDNDLLVFNSENSYSTSIAAGSKAKKIGYPGQESAHVVDGQFAYGEHIICSIDMLQIPGPHNISNALAAIDAIWKYTQDGTAIENGIRSFKGLKHRLSFVREIDNVSYYDDSIATTPGSAIAALRAFEGPKVLILGGSSKGSDFSDLAAEVLKHDVQAILIGDEAAAIADAFNTAGFETFEIMEQPTMQKIVSRASELAKPGGVVLLSPASASFGLFKNYADRGDQFIDAVTQL